MCNRSSCSMSNCICSSSSSNMCSIRKIVFVEVNAVLVVVICVVVCAGEFAKHKQMQTRYNAKDGVKCFPPRKFHISDKYPLFDQHA